MTKNQPTQEPKQGTARRRWRVREGRLLIGSSVNVALRVKTVQTIFHEFETTMDPPIFRAHVEACGKACAETFYQDFKAQALGRGKDVLAKAGLAEEDVREKLDLWAEYDSRTGMGLFDVRNAFVGKDNTLRGQIRVRNSFLAHERDSTDPTCSFLVGYIEGMIFHLLGIRARIHECLCSSVSKSGECVFESVAPPPA